MVVLTLAAGSRQRCFGRLAAGFRSGLQVLRADPIIVCVNNAGIVTMRIQPWRI
jgi:hypothetical protein